MYINGNPVATNTTMTLHPSSLATATQPWLGRSAFGDPFLNATIDDLNVYNSALSAAQITTLATGGQPGAGNVADYKFDEASGATATDSSGNGYDATITAPTVTNSCDGNAFLNRDLTTGNLVCWKDQQNFLPFVAGIPPDTAQYTQALRFYANSADYPIFPEYTADQADKAAATAFGQPGTNNFSNINATIQAQVYGASLRHYPTPYITAQMYKEMIEWLTWNEDINGNNQLPDNNEYYFNWNPTTQTLGRSSINHDTLGSYNRMIFQDIAGLQPRVDSTIELWPIDMGYDYFTVNNMSYHGHNVTIVWQRPGTTQHYPLAPMGYSLYVDGQLAFTASDLVHLTWNSNTGQVQILDTSTNATVANNQAIDSVHGHAGQPGDPTRARTNELRDAGVDQRHQPDRRLRQTRRSARPRPPATRQPAPASAAATSPANAVGGYTKRSLPVTSGSYVGTNPILGRPGTPNASDWLQIDLGAPTRHQRHGVNFYSNKATFGSGGSTYAQPTAYTLQYFDGTSKDNASNQALNPATAGTELQREDTFTPATAAPLLGA